MRTRSSKTKSWKRRRSRLFGITKGLIHHHSKQLRKLRPSQSGVNEANWDRSLLGTKLRT